MDIKEKRLVMDFIIEGDDRSMHVLNSVSPAFTCSIPFSKHVCDEIEHRIDGSRTPASKTVLLQQSQQVADA